MTAFQYKVVVIVYAHTSERSSAFVTTLDTGCIKDNGANPPTASRTVVNPVIGNPLVPDLSRESSCFDGRFDAPNIGKGCRRTRLTRQRASAGKEMC